MAGPKAKEAVEKPRNLKIAVPPNLTSPVSFGTAVMPRAGALKKELWQGQVELVSMQDDGEANMGVLGRRIARSSLTTAPSKPPQPPAQSLTSASST